MIGVTGLDCTCDSKLPDGRMVRDVVKDLQNQLDDVIKSALLANLNVKGPDPNAAALGAFVKMAWPNGPMDFKNTMRGRAGGEFLGQAGNFVYYAAWGNILVPAP